MVYYDEQNLNCASFFLDESMQERINLNGSRHPDTHADGIKEREEPDENETQITDAEARLQTLAAYERRSQARQRAFGGDGTSSRSGMRGRYGQQKRENVRECCALGPGRSGNCMRISILCGRNELHCSR